LAGGAVVVAAGAAVLAVRGESLPDWRVSTALLVVFGGATIAMGALRERITAERSRADRRDRLDTLTGLANREHTQRLLATAFDGSRETWSLVRLHGSLPTPRDAEAVGR
jgi:hypothetical protein